MEALRRGLVTTRESGNRFNESHMASALAGMEVKYGDPLAALDYITFAIRNYHDAGSVAFFHSPLAHLAAILGRLGRFDFATIVIGYAALSPMTWRGESGNNNDSGSPAGKPWHTNLRVVGAGG